MSIEEDQDIKTIGLLGGYSQVACQDIHDYILRVSRRLIPQYVNRGVPLVWTRDDNQSPVLLDDAGEVMEPLRPSPSLLIGAGQMTEVGANFLVMTSHTAHFFQRQVEEVSGLTVLSMVDVTLDEVVRRGSQRVGILAISLTLKHKLYQDRLDKMGISYETIPSNFSEKVDESVWAISEGTTTNRRLKEPVMESLKFLRARGADSIILGCTELPLILGKTYLGVKKDVINPNELIAEAAVRYAI